MACGTLSPKGCGSASCPSRGLELPWAGGRDCGAVSLGAELPTTFPAPLPLWLAVPVVS